MGRENKDQSDREIENNVIARYTTTNTMVVMMTHIALCVFCMNVCVVAVFSMRLRALDRHIASNHKDESAKYRRQALHIKRYRLLLYLKRKDIRSYVNMLDMFDIPPVRSRNRMMRPSGVA